MKKLFQNIFLAALFLSAAVCIILFMTMVYAAARFYLIGR